MENVGSNAIQTNTMMKSHTIPIPITKLHYNDGKSNGHPRQQELANIGPNPVEDQYSDDKYWL